MEQLNPNMFIQSRRVWFTRHPKRSSLQLVKLNILNDNKPWPLSIRVAAAVLAGTLGPYAIGFIFANSPVLYNQWPESVRAQLRTHFGADEVNGSTWPQQLRGEPVPKVLRGEASWRERQLQAEHDRVAQTTIAATIVTENHDEMHVVLPARVLATHQHLKNYINGDATIVHVEFGRDVEEENSNGDLAMTTTNDNPSSDSSPQDVASSVEQQEEDPLISRIQIFSTWFHVPERQHQGNTTASVNNKNNSTQSDAQVQMDSLQYTIAQLANELQSANPSRSIDDITQELQQTKANLRRLKKGQWWWWPF
jgi:hypothetical protein